MQIAFQAVSNRTYVVQYTDSLSPIQWVNLSIEPAKTNSRPASVIDRNPNPKRYYRLGTPAQP
jgi:hypothetical protein